MGRVCKRLGRDEQDVLGEPGDFRGNRHVGGHQESFVNEPPRCQNRAASTATAVS
jgi:hypothetical protein